MILLFPSNTKGRITDRGVAEAHLLGDSGKSFACGIKFPNSLHLIYCKHRRVVFGSLPGISRRSVAGICPSLIPNDSLHKRSPYSGRQGYLSRELARVAEPSHVTNLIDCKHGVVMPFPVGKASLSLAIGHVGHLISEEQMIGSNAAWNIARVKHVHPFGDWPVQNYPGRTMREFALAVTPVDSSVAVPVSVSYPKPAVIGLTNFGPESFPEVCVKSRRKRRVLCNRCVWHRRIAFHLGWRGSTQKG